MEFLYHVPLRVQQLSESVYRGSKVTMRVRDAFATGYLVGVDDHDYMLATTYDGENELDPPLLIIVNRRMVSVVNCHPESTYSEEEEAVRSFLDPMRDELMDKIANEYLSIEQDASVGA